MKPSDSGAYKFDQSDEHLLVTPEGGVRPYRGYPLKEVGSLNRRGGAGEYGVLKGLGGREAIRAGRVRIWVLPGGVCS